jgi:hypothetical protein
MRAFAAKFTTLIEHFKLEVVRLFFTWRFALCMRGVVDNVKFTEAMSWTLALRFAYIKTEGIPRPRRIMSRAKHGLDVERGQLKS